jgi:hypothetical protein
LAGVYGFTPALTSFVGRAAAVNEVAELLNDHRLVTVTGPGGVGKTRLAGEVARRVAGRFADGVWLVELAAVTDPLRVPSAMAAALGLRERPGVPLADSLTGALAGWQVLLVLDNCEHVIADPDDQPGAGRGKRGNPVSTAAVGAAREGTSGAGRL